MSEQFQTVKEVLTERDQLKAQVEQLRAEAAGNEMFVARLSDILKTVGYDGKSAIVVFVSALLTGREKMRRDVARRAVNQTLDVLFRAGHSVDKVSINGVDRVVDEVLRSES